MWDMPQPNRERVSSIRAAISLSCATWTQVRLSFVLHSDFNIGSDLDESFRRRWPTKIRKRTRPFSAEQFDCICNTSRSITTLPKPIPPTPSNLPQFIRPDQIQKIYNSGITD
jgi:hypothetical protein